MSEGAVPVSDAGGQGGQEVAVSQGASAVLEGGGGAPPVEATPASQVVAPTQEAAPSWHEGMNLSSDTVQLFEAKGWHKAENPLEQLSKGYRNLERLRGVPGDQLVRVPEPGNEEQAAEFYARLGVPESPDAYESPEVEVLGQPLDPKPLAAISHALRLTPEQHAGLMQQAAALIESAQADSHANLNARLSAEKVELEVEWGAALEENTLAAKTGFQALEWSADQIDAVEAAIGYKGVMKLGAFIGRLSQEHRRGDDGQGGAGATLAYGLTREAAKSLLASEGPELAKKIAAGDRSAKQRLDDLNRVAFH